MNIKKIEQHCHNIKSNKIFELLVLLVIVISALAIGVKSYDPHPKIIFYLIRLDYFISLIFLAEILIRLLAENKIIDFFKSGWNIFDFIIVTVSIIPITGNETILVARLLRIFRVLRLISYIPELSRIVTTVGKAIPRIGYVTLLMFVIFYIYGTVGNIFFDYINPFLWADIPTSMLTLFRVITLEDWTDVMYEVIKVYPYSWIYFISFIFIVGFIFLNIMVAIVLDVWQETVKKISTHTKKLIISESEYNQIKIESASESDPNNFIDDVESDQTITGLKHSKDTEEKDTYQIHNIENHLLRLEKKIDDLYSR